MMATRPGERKCVSADSSVIITRQSKAERREPPLELPQPRPTMAAYHKACLYRLRLSQSKPCIQKSPMRKIARLKKIWRTKEQQNHTNHPDFPEDFDTARRGTISTVDEYPHEAESRCDSGMAQQETLSQMAYGRACRHLQVVPSAAFYKGLARETIKLRRYILGAEGAKACAIALVNNMAVTELELTGNDVGPEGAEAIAEMMKENMSITSLTVAENNIGTTGVSALAEAMKVNAYLKKLDLSGNGLQDEDAEWIATIIEETITLSELSLSHNGFQEKGGEIIAGPIGQHLNLEDLDLSWNHLRREGAVAICLGLQESQSLMKVNLGWNGFAREGSKAMRHVLENNKMLTDLDLSCNRIDAECITDLIKGLQKNDTLKILRLSLNSITSDGALCLLKAIESHKTPAIEQLDIKGQSVNAHFLNTVNKIREQRRLRVTYGTLLRSEAHGPQGDPQDEFVRDDPMLVLMEFMRLKNLRLMDLFKSLDTDNSQSLSRQEIKEGLLNVNIPLSSAGLDKLIDKLDKDGDGEVDFRELMVGQKEHKKKMMQLVASANADGIPIEETKIGRVSAKLQALMAFMSPRLKKSKTALLVSAAVKQMKRISEEPDVKTTQRGGNSVKP